ncbi:MAG: hypothetical protein CMQ19_08060 [Gammaproteobacteria bacterium]|nr:hypothetical protein [Gammaproteobacteria bacterium]|tara:strand:+ start:5527 stop:6480 length:954 start_codon:yes stop_codon:yes gene_type:complete
MTDNNIETLVEPLSGFISRKLEEDARVTEVRRLAEGHSRQMLLIHVEVAGAEQRYVVRIEQDGIFGTSSAEEFRVMGALHGLGFPVAQVRWLEDNRDVLGEPFFVMDFVEGDFDNPTGDTLKEFVTVLDRLHKLDWQDAGLDFDLKPESVEEATHMQIDRWANIYRDATPLPIPLLEEAAAWLHYRAPASGPFGVVHGDPGPGNFVHDKGEILALTDFEFCHLGHVYEDWVFCAVMRGPRSLSTDGWIELYQELTDTKLTAEEWRYWQVFNLFKGACANTTSLRVFCAGKIPAPNLAIVGTAIHQNFVFQLTGLISD